MTYDPAAPSDQIDSAAIIWRCRHCGKWSTAKRDPIAHTRWHHEGPEMQGWFVWCGPFDRWTAVHNDVSPRDELPRFDEPVDRHEREMALLGIDPMDEANDDNQNEPVTVEAIAKLLSKEQR